MAPLVPYDTWCAVAGFFDGDGGLDVEVRKNTLHWVLNFTDNWPPQLAQIKSFLQGQGVQVGNLRPTGTGGFKILVAAVNCLIQCAQSMLQTSCVFKKRRELETMLRYFGGELTGNEVIDFLNEEVRAGIRVGKLRSSVLPYTYPEGLRVYKRGYKRIGPSTLEALTPRQKCEIRTAYESEGLTIYELAPKYGVSPSTIFRAVRGLRRGTQTSVG